MISQNEQTNYLGRTLNWYRKCKRCHSVENLTEIKHPCGCVNLFCEDCLSGNRERRKGKNWIPIKDWIKSYSRLHKKNGGKRDNLPCPIRWDDERWWRVL